MKNTVRRMLLAPAAVGFATSYDLSFPSWKSLRAIRISQIAVVASEPKKIRSIVPAVEGMSIKAPAAIPTRPNAKAMAMSDSISI